MCIRKSLRVGGLSVRWLGGLPIGSRGVREGELMQNWGTVSGMMSK